MCGEPILLRILSLSEREVEREQMMTTVSLTAQDQISLEISLSSRTLRLPDGHLYRKQL